MKLYDTNDPREGDTRPLPERLQDSIKVELGGKLPTLLRFWNLWQDDSGNPVPFYSPSSGPGAWPHIQLVHQYWPQIVPYITWDAATGWGNDSLSYYGITTKDVAAGRLDDYIRQYARDTKVYGQPLFISPICKEFNLRDHRNCSPKANPALTEADFISAWRRVVDIFRQEGVANVAWVWVPNSIAPPSWGPDNAAAYYPGDDYVDWMGVDHYDYGPPSLMDAVYDFAVAHHKPVFVAEWGVRSGQGSTTVPNLTPAQDQQWINAMFDYFETHPQIKAICYFNYNAADPTQETPEHMANHVWLYNGQVNYHPNIGNWDSRLLAESGADFRHTYARRIANPRYVSELVK
jgi:hypothetical protein